MGDARFQTEPISELSTGSLELVYITLQILQKKEYLFNTPEEVVDAKLEKEQSQKEAAFRKQIGPKEKLLIIANP